MIDFSPFPSAFLVISWQNQYQIPVLYLDGTSLIN